jgi:putative nucleotidyltransferase with HDIG domain
MKMKFSSRVFLLTFIPIALVLLGTFVATQYFITQGVKEGLRASLRETHAFLSRSRAAAELQNSRLLSIVAENPSLKAGIELARQQPNDAQARATLEDQLSEYGELLGFDLLWAHTARDRALAGVVRKNVQLEAMSVDSIGPVADGVVSLEDRVYFVSTLPVNVGSDYAGSLTIGRGFDLAEFTSPTVLIHDGRVIGSNIENYRIGELDKALTGCDGQEECEVQLNGETMLSLAVTSLSLGDGYHLRSLQSVDRASVPVQSVVTGVFSAAASIALIAVLLVSGISARSIVKPLTSLADKLKSNRPDGSLPTLDISSTTYEVDELVQAFNRASASVKDGRDRLSQAYTEFIASISSAVDARDVYTAGHSRRVSDYSNAIAEAMVLKDQIEIVRIGALLHDVGKIGIPDDILQKAGALTAEEFDCIKQHPAIGKRILDRIEAFERYVPVVELHHENHDGSGYPWGLRGEQIPVSARIVHVADAYDAMVTNRPYRKGMSHQRALEILEQHAGSQFDPAVVAAFLRCCEAAAGPPVDAASQGLHRLAAGIDGAGRAAALETVEREA